jgi:hypothetical protein
MGETRSATGHPEVQVAERLVDCRSVELRHSEQVLALHGEGSVPARDLALVVPIFNDFESLARLCREIDACLPDWQANLSIIAVDDGSTQPAEPLEFDPPLVNIRQILLIKLRCNLGHQKAIAIGLVEAAGTRAFDAVIVADSDGEDRPVDVGRLIAAYRRHPGAVVVARRSRRSEGLRFRAFYALYKALFRIFTGKTINFGNFVLIPNAILERLVNMTEIWNHIAAGILRAGVPLKSVGCCRGMRYAGTSSMSLINLLIHGLSAVAVFSEVVFARMLLASAAITAFAIAMAGSAIVIRLTTKLAIPGWATTVVGFSLVLLSQALLLSMVSSLMMLGGRSATSVVPSVHAKVFISDRLTILENCRCSQDRNADFR